MFADTSQTNTYNQAGIFRIYGGISMEKLRLLGVLCISVIALASACMISNDPLVSNLVNAVFIISCGVIGISLLRTINLSETLSKAKR